MNKAKRKALRVQSSLTMVKRTAARLTRSVEKLCKHVKLLEAQQIQTVKRLEEQLEEHIKCAVATAVNVALDKIHENLSETIKDSRM